MGRLNAGDLNTRCVLQRDTTTAQDSRGALVPSFSDVITVWAELIQNNGRELQVAKQIVAETTCLVKIRYRRDVHPKMRARLLTDSTAFTATAATDLITFVDRYVLNGEVLRFTTSGTLPAGLSTGTDYYTRDTTGLTCKLSASKNGPVINLTSAGSGTHYAWRSRLLEINSAYDPEGRREYLLLGCKEPEPRL